jgi:ribosomal protein S10
LKHYRITLRSKNKKSLNKFIKFFINNLNFKQINKFYTKKTKKKIFTILKSPHINKSAQEQFKINFYALNFIFYSEQTNKILKITKKMKLNLFSDISIQIKAFFSKNLLKKTHIGFFNPNNFNSKNLSFCSYKNKNYNYKDLTFNYNKLKQLISIYETFGELSI